MNSMVRMEANNLINEKSPYLQQHAHNPVNWYPWGEEALEKAKAENKLIFLSIGYSTCHWCHVMARESFSDDKVAEILNQDYISIKVDREERPDLDNIYMAVSQIVTGSGGWPLNVILTPDQKPFFAATYIPKHSKFGRMGMVELLTRITTMWKKTPQDFYDSSESIVKALNSLNDKEVQADITDNTIDKAYRELLKSFDERKGGFSKAPKFPSAHIISFLLTYSKEKNSPEALQMAEKTLQEMRKGGIFDHVGFGFHRYATDRDWILPHFEKMLYDQAALLDAYTEAYKLTKNELYRGVAEEILSYLSKEMLAPEGAFYSAENAESEGEEGKFYVWSTADLRSTLSQEDYDLVTKVFSVKDEGNFREESTGELTGYNILYNSRSLESIAEEYETDAYGIDQRLSKIRTYLQAARQKRIPPEKDDKILTDWNSFLIAAIAKAGMAFENEYFINQAETSLNFILGNMLDDQNQLKHRYKDGESKVNGFLDDYAHLIRALLFVYEGTLKPEYIKKAVALTETMVEKFWDVENKGFFFVETASEELIHKPKEYYDSAMPSGNSIAMDIFVRLFFLTGKESYQTYAEELIHSVGKKIQTAPSAFCHLLQSWIALQNEFYRVTISGNAYSYEIEEIINYVNKNHNSNLILLRAEDVTPEGKENYNSSETKVMICTSKACHGEITTLEEFKNVLRE